MLDIYTLDKDNDSVAFQFSIDVTGHHAGNETLRGMTAYGRRLIWADANPDTIHSAYLNIGSRTLTNMLELASITGTSPEGLTIAGTKLLSLNSDPDEVESWTYTPPETIDDSLVQIEDNERTVQESMTISDILTTVRAAISTTKTLMESVSISATLATGREVKDVVLADVTQIGDMLATSITRAYVRSLAAPHTISDAVAKVFKTKRVSSETGTISDNVSRTKDQPRRMMETLQISDHARAFRLRVLEEMMTIEDNASLGFKRIVSTTMTISDIVAHITILTLNRARLKLSFVRREFLKLFRAG